MNITSNVQVAAIKLFHSVVNTDSKNRMNTAELIKYGILPITSEGIVTSVDAEAGNLLIQTLGLKPVDWAQSFHKSWDKVATASIEQLVFEQIMNYFSTYGMEAMGFQSLNYVPVEKILIDLDEKPALAAFTIIRIISEDELKSEFVDMLTTMKAPHMDLIKHIETLMPYAKGMNIDDIKSFEIKIMYCDIYKRVPLNGQDFLRFAIYKASYGATTTIVKDQKTIAMLKSFASTKTAEQLFEVADLTILSESFLRFKPLFLAFKANAKIAPKINKIRRLAVQNHKPVTGFTVSNLMNLLAQNRREDALKVIAKADMRELVKLINFASYELMSKDHIYNIRNGKSFVKVNSDAETNAIDVPVRIENINWLLSTCKTQMKTRLNGAFAGMNFYIPNGIKYVVPVSEKQMMDVLPYGTKVFIPDNAKALCVGGHWVNGCDRVDLDFHMHAVSGSVGWNSSYRTDSGDLLFSGDMTDAPAPNGAVEAFRISSNVSVPYELNVSLFSGTMVPYEILFTKDITNDCDFSRGEESMISAVINPANALAPAIKLMMHNHNETIGYFYNKAFTVVGGGLGGNTRVPNSELMVKAMQASVVRYDAMMDLVDFINLAGGNIVRTLDETVTEYVDLTTGNLTPNTLFDVVDVKTDRLPKVVIKPVEETTDETTDEE